jgi:hypothetical protein
MAFTIAGLYICHIVEVYLESYQGRSTFLLAFLLLTAAFLRDGL